MPAAVTFADSDLSYNNSDNNYYVNDAVRRISDDLSRKKLTDVEEGDESSEGTTSASVSPAPYYYRRSNSRSDRKSSIASNASLDTLWELHPRRLSEAGLRRTSDASVVLTEDTDSFIIGQKVWVGGSKPGQIAYIGETQFAPGEWAGIVLDEPIGKNDGSVAGIRYFQCESRRGVFSRLTRLTKYPLPQLQRPSPPPATPEAVMARSSRPSVTPTTKPSPMAATGRRGFQATSPTGSTRGSLSVNRSLNVSNTSLASNSHCELKLGERVIVRSSATTGSKVGTLRFVGTTEFAPGEWCGVELDDPIGKNDGSVDGISYFECQPFYGLFTPSSKVTKSPSSRRPSTTPCVVHRGGPGSTTSGLRRSNSRESMNSMTSSIASSVRTTSSRVRLGVTSLNARMHGTPTNAGATAKKTTPASAALVTKLSLQEALRDKDAQVTKLLRERELERAEVTRAATQADHAEQLLATLTKDYEMFRLECEAKLQEKDGQLVCVATEKEALLAQLDEEKRRAEDLQFKFEESAIHKVDTEVANKTYVNRIKELETSLDAERLRLESLEQDSNKLFEAEEALGKTREELDALKHELEKGQAEAANALITDLRKEIDQLKTQNDDKDTKYEEALNKLQVNLEEKRESRDHEIQIILEQNQKEIQALRLQLEEALTHVKESEVIIEEQKKEIEQLNGKVEQAHANLELKTQDLCQQAQKNEIKLQKELENVQTELGVKSAALDANVEETKKKEDEIVQLQVQLEAVRHELVLKDEHLDNHVRNKRESEAQYQQDMQDVKSLLTQANANLEDQKVAAAKDMLAAQTQLASQQQQLESHQSTVARLKSELSSHQTAVQSSAASQLELHSAFIQQKDSKILELNSQFESKCQELAQCHDINTKQVQQIHQQTAQIETYKHDFEILYQKLNNEEKINCNLTAKMNSMELLIGDLERKLSAADQNVMILTEHKQKLEIEVQQLISASTNADGQLADLNIRYRQLGVQLDQCHQESINKQHMFERKEQECQQNIIQLQQQLQNEQAAASAKLADDEEIRNQLEQKIQTLMIEAQNQEKNLKSEIMQITQICNQKQITWQQEREQCQLNENNLNAQLVQFTQESQRNLQVCHENEKSLKDEVNQLKNALKDKSELLIELESKCKRMFSECQQQCGDIQKQCSMDIKKCNEDLMNTRTTLAHRDQQLSALTMQMNQLNQVKISLESHVTEQTKILENVRGELTKCQAEHQHAQQELLSKNNEVVVLSSKITQINQQMTNCEARLAESNNRAEAISRECTQIKEEKIMNERHCADKDQQILALTQLKQQFEQEKQIITLHCSQKDSKVKELQMEIEQMRNQKCVECESRQDMLKKQYDSTTEVCAKKDKDILILNQKLNQIQMECRNVQTERQMWHQEFEKAKNHSMTIESQCNEKERQIVQLHHQIQMVTQQKNQEAEQRVNVLNQQINQYKVDITNIQMECQRKDQAIQNLEHSVRETEQRVCAEAEQRIVVLQQQCEQVKREFQTTQQQCQEKERVIVILKQEVQDTARRVCQEAEQKVMVIQRECEQVKQEFQATQQQCQDRDRQIIILKQEVQETERRVCREAEQKVLVIQRECDQLKSNFQNVQQECERKEQQLLELRRPKEVPCIPQPCEQPNVTQPIIVNQCEEQNQKIVILSQEIEKVQRAKCENIEAQCQPIVMHEVQRQCDNKMIVIQNLQAENNMCQQARQQCGLLQADTQRISIELGNCKQEQANIEQQCKAEIHKSTMEINTIKMQNQCEQLRFEIQQKDIVIANLKQQEMHSCDLLKMELKQREDQISLKQSVIEQLQATINNASRVEEHMNCDFLKITIQQQMTELTQKAQIINELETKIQTYAQQQQELTSCRLLELQLQQKDLDIGTKGKIIEELQNALRVPRPCADNINLNILKMQIEQKDKMLQNKDVMIAQLQKEMQHCKKITLQDTVTSNCDSFMAENTKLLAELTWHKSSLTELEMKFQALQRENTELVAKIGSCTSVQVAHKESGSYQLEKLALLEQIEELKCELEERAKELILCKTKSPCRASKTNDNQYSLLLETLRQEKSKSDLSWMLTQHESSHMVSGSSANAGATGGSGLATGLSVNSQTSGGEWQLQEAQSQIQFLNSIIVDMQQKNEQLRAKVEALEATGCVPVQSFDHLLRPRVQAPRMFCDICDEFDLHETEDCPHQDSGSPPAELVTHHPPKGPALTTNERPYCEICEVFGHSTEDCDDAETF